MEKIDALILAGGRGTRLQSVVSDVPKPLAPVGGRPFLDYQLAALARSGSIGTVVLSLGFQAEKVVDHCTRNPPPLPVTFVTEKEALGTGGGVRFALGSTSARHVLVINGDSMFDWDVPALSAAHEGSGLDATLALVEVDDVGRYGTVTLDDGRIGSFVEKSRASGPGLINAGFILFERSILEALPGGAYSLEQDVLVDLAQWGRLGGVGFRSDFIDIGLPETYAAAGNVVPGLAIAS